MTPHIDTTKCTLPEKYVECPYNLDCPHCPWYQDAATFLSRIVYAEPDSYTERDIARLTHDDSLWESAEDEPHDCDECAAIAHEYDGMTACESGGMCPYAVAARPGNVIVMSDWMRAHGR